MISDHNNQIEEFVAHAVAGALVGQVAAERDITPEDLIANRDGAINTLGHELASLGIDPDYTAKAILFALATLFMENSNANRIVDSLTDLLWTVLGPPEGGPPPEIYRRAGIAMHLAFVGLLNPNYVDNTLKKQ